jgi:hypothetical protein
VLLARGCSEVFRAVLVEAGKGRAESQISP